MPGVFLRKIVKKEGKKKRRPGSTFHQGGRKKGSSAGWPSVERTMKAVNSEGKGEEKKEGGGAMALLFLLCVQGREEGKGVFSPMRYWTTREEEGEERREGETIVLACIRKKKRKSPAFG